MSEIETILSVRPDDLSRLTPSRAVDVLRELLWAEARRLGVSISLINVPSSINVKDGGVDGEFRGHLDIKDVRLLKPTLTRYQVKTGDFQITDMSIKKLLFSESTSELKSRIKSCLDNNGCLIFVFFGWDKPEQSDEQLVRKIKAQLDQKYKDANIEIWRQNNIISFLSDFPSLALRVNQRHGAHFQTFDTWSKNADIYGIDYKPGPEQQQLIASIQDNIRTNGRNIHIRILGEAGIGKTRLAFEAVNVNDLSPLTIYCQHPNTFWNSDLQNIILRDDQILTAILVVDECDQANRAELWRRIKYCASSIKLITIHNEFEELPADIFKHCIPELPTDKIQEIIESYVPHLDHPQRWIELCTGSPRVAHVIGLNLKNNPDDMLMEPSETRVWDRYIVGGDDPDSQQVKRRIVVLRYVGLFKKFGIDIGHEKEVKAISAIINKNHPEITEYSFHEIVNNLKERKILQGENVCYITPKLLHIKLWKDWWDNYGRAFDLNSFIKDMPPQLVEWFFEMFKYAAESVAASKTIETILGPDGPFREDDELIRTRLGGRFFLAASEGNPKAALGYLSETICKWDNSTLLSFRSGRREVVWALEKLAVWDELFIDSAKILLRLAVAENEEFANNATGVFTDLFSLACGQAGTTEAPPEKRFGVLKSIISSPSKQERLIAIKACEKALNSRDTVRVIGSEYQGLRQPPKLWVPNTYGDLFDAYRTIWKLLEQRFASIVNDDDLSDERDKIIDVLTSNARPLTAIKSLSSDILDTIRALSSKEYARRKCLELISSILHHNSDRLDKDAYDRWKALHEQLVGDNYASMLFRYVGMDLYSDTSSESRDRIIAYLAKESVQNPKLLEDELHWLVTKEAHNGYNFGYFLSKEDSKISLYEKILATYRAAKNNASVYFLSGYCRHISENNPDKWEEMLDEISKDVDLRHHVPELTWRTKLTERSAKRLLDLARSNIIGPQDFSYFRFGGSTNALSVEMFNEWISYLIGIDSYEALFIALDLYFGYYVYRKNAYDMPKEQSLALLTNRVWACRGEGQYNQMDEHNWAETAKKFMSLYPEESIALARFILDSYDMDGSLFGSYNKPTDELLTIIIKERPSGMWDLVTSKIDSEDTLVYSSISRWFKKILTFIPNDDLWSWVGEDAAKRAPFIASIAPLSLESSITRELLTRCGESYAVRSALMSNYISGAFSGSASAHYGKKKEYLERARSQEKNKNILQWIDEAIKLLADYIKEMKIQEERRGY